MTSTTTVYIHDRKGYIFRASVEYYYEMRPYGDRDERELVVELLEVRAATDEEDLWLPVCEDYWMKDAVLDVIEARLAGKRVA